MNFDSLRGWTFIGFQFEARTRLELIFFDFVSSSPEPSTRRTSIVAEYPERFLFCDYRLHDGKYPCVVQVKITESEGRFTGVVELNEGRISFERAKSAFSVPICSPR